MPSITKRKRNKSAIHTARVTVAEAKYPYLALRKPRRATGKARYVIFYLDANGKRQEGGTGAFDGQLELAQEAFAAFKAKNHAPAFGDGKPNQVLITDVLSYYAKRKIDSGNSDEVCRADTATAALKNLGTFFSEYTVADLTPDLADDYVQWRIRLGDARGSNKWKKREPKQGRLLKPSTAWNDIRFLNSALFKTWSNHKLTHQISITLPTEAFSDKRERCLSRHETALLLAAALGWDARTGKRDHGLTANAQKVINYPLARFIISGYRSGTRKERVLRLQKVQNFQGGWVDVEKGILHRKADNEKDTNKRAPSMAMSDRLWSMMRRWCRLSARFVIEQGNGRPYKDLDTAFANACVRAGLSIEKDDPMKVTPHTLRHTAVTMMLDDGMSCWETGQAVGMSAQMVEARYGHGSLAQQRTVFRRVDDRAARPSAPNVLSHSRLTKMRKGA